MCSDICYEFIEKTKYANIGPSGQQQGFPAPPLETPFEGDGQIYALPSPDNVQTDIKELIDARVSIRSYQDKSISQDQLSFLLWCTQGVKKVDAPYSTFRTVPSAGARHALETYILVNNVDGLKPGLYRYLALEHKIAEYLINDKIANDLVLACLGQRMVRAASATFIWVAVPDRMTWRYPQRGYRYMFLDAGHVCQNLYLSAESIGYNVCAIAAYDDDAVNKLLGIDGKSQFAIYLAAAGKKSDAAK